MCVIYIHPKNKAVDIDVIAKRMGLKAAVRNGRVVLLTPHHERMPALRNAARFGQGGKVTSTWLSPGHDNNDPEPPAAA